MPPRRQERFHDFLPALERWAGVVVGLTLLAIGALGIYETYFERHDDHDHGHGHGELELVAATGAFGYYLYK